MHLVSAVSPSVRPSAVRVRPSFVIITWSNSSPDPSAMPLLQDGKRENSSKVTLTFAETEKRASIGAKMRMGTPQNPRMSHFSTPAVRKSRIVNAAICTTFPRQTTSKYPRGGREEREADHFHESTTALDFKLHVECLERDRYGRNAPSMLAFSPSSLS